MTPTPFPTPSYVVTTVVEQGLVNNPLPFIGVVWAVALLFVFVSLTEDRQRSQMAFLIIAVVSSPLLFLNYGLYGLTVYFFVLLYLVVSTFRRVV